MALVVREFSEDRDAIGQGATRAYPDRVMAAIPQV